MIWISRIFLRAQSGGSAFGNSMGQQNNMSQGGQSKLGQNAFLGAFLGTCLGEIIGPLIRSALT